MTFQPLPGKLKKFGKKTKQNKESSQGYIQLQDRY